MKIILLSILFSVQAFGQNREALSPKRFELLSGIRKESKNKDTKAFWDKKYSKSNYVFGKKPARFLSRNYDFIPQGAKVLDMGMGEGRHAVFLARKGYKVTGVDISSVAVKKARALAREFGVRINTVVASMEKYKIKPGTFDAIICFYYVDRKLNEKMKEWLKPGGILIYEAHTDNQRKVEGSEHFDKRYLLRPSELLSLFGKDMQILKYEEPMHMPEYTASIILQKKK
ncbi:MAG: class I SAM-dependent methyltransferase [Deltaproteobacteria bacterium]|nr:MAG: class I SAM-dependent methyltransferase [Deltaproteobacteria bacterium]TNF27565.1 MAG: class I SAM-dependent methyltransferase [Deltaproteobacteria bacterium]